MAHGFPVAPVVLQDILTSRFGIAVAIPAVVFAVVAPSTAVSCEALVNDEASDLQHRVA